MRYNGGRRMEKLLFIDATLNEEKPSRTYQLCQGFLEEFKKRKPQCTIHHLMLNREAIKHVTFNDIRERERLVLSKETDHPALKHAVEFATADYIVIGAPYWDLSFPAILKMYLERICVCGITFCYTDTGIKGLCNAKNMIYFTASGGHIGQYDFGTDYLKGMCEGLFGIAHFHTANVQGLDIVGVEVAKILEEGCERAKYMANLI